MRLSDDRVAIIGYQLAVNAAIAQGRPTEPHATLTSSSHRLSCSLPHQSNLILAHSGPNLKHEFTSGGRCVQVFIGKHQAHPGSFQISDEIEQVPKTTRHPVTLRRHNCIDRACCHHVQHATEPGTVKTRTRHAAIGNDIDDDSSSDR